MSTNKATENITDTGGTPPLHTRAAPPRPLHHRSAATRARIFEATERLLADTPVHELAVAEIIEHAQVSRPTFYYHFNSKYEVVGGLLSTIIEEITAVVASFRDADPLASGDPPIELYGRALRESLLGVTQIWHKHRAVMQASSGQWHSVPELEALWRGVTDGFIDDVATTIEALRAQGIAPTGPPARTVAATLAWATERCLFVASLEVDPDLPNEQTVIEPLVAMWLGAVFGDISGRDTTIKRS